jgi:hypothetical protein
MAKMGPKSLNEILNWSELRRESVRLMPTGSSAYRISAVPRRSGAFGETKNFEFERGFRLLARHCLRDETA